MRHRNLTGEHGFDLVGRPAYVDNCEKRIQPCAVSAPVPELRRVDEVIDLGAHESYATCTEGILQPFDDAWRKCERWRRDYNDVRPPSTIGYDTPAALVKRSSATSPP